MTGGGGGADGGWGDRVGGGRWREAVEETPPQSACINTDVRE